MPDDKSDKGKELTKEAQKKLFEKLRTKKKFYLKNRGNCQSMQLSNDNSKEIMLTKINYYSSKVKVKQKLLDDLAIYDDISKIRNKYKIIKTLHQPGKKRLHPVDLFCFDKKRWQKQTVDTVKDNKDKHANQTSVKTKEKLMKMRNESSLLNQISGECDFKRCAT